MKKIIVREYIESLTERDELDYLFPLLLEVLDFRIIIRPTESKGVAEYGKDIIAIGLDPFDNIKKIIYFEVKGGADKNVTPSTFSKEDGIRESLIEAKDVVYNDESIPELKKHPVKIILVHNGVLNTTVRDTFDGFVKREFSNSNDPHIEFERWDIFRLTELFEQYLFNEYLMIEESAFNLFKRMLILHTTPENNQQYFFRLINHLFENTTDVVPTSKNIPRKTLMFFETLRLIGFMSYTISKQEKNILIALKCNSFLLCKTWSWIIKFNLINNKKIINLFTKLKSLHFDITNEFFNKSLEVATSKNGLYYDDAGRYEIVGHPIRCFNYLAYFNHFYEASQNKKEVTLNAKNYINTVKSLINNNNGMARPILDIHSVSIIKTILILSELGEVEFAKTYTLKVIENLIKQTRKFNILPDARNNFESVVKFYALKEKSIYYEDNISYLIGQLAEICCLLNYKDGYNLIVKNFSSIILATFIPYDDINSKDYLDKIEVNQEVCFFSKGLYREGYQSEIKLEPTFKEFYDKTKLKTEDNLELKTSDTSFFDLIYLAHFVFGSPLFPSLWRSRIV